MRRHQHALAALAALGTVLLAACGNSAAPATPSATDVGVTKDSILLGGTIPLSGPAAAYGTIDKSADAYFQYVNDNGGVNGRKITFKYLDDDYNLTGQTSPLTKQLVEQDQVFAMFSGLGTQAQTSVRDYLNAKKVPQLFVATGATTFSAQFKQYPYTYGWQPVYQGEAAVYAKFIKQTTPNAKIGVIYQNDDYGQDYLNGLTKALGSSASTMIVDKESNGAGDADLTSQILKLKASGADTFMIFETPSPAILSLVTAYKVGWHPTIYLNSVAAPIPYVQIAEKAAGDPASVNGILTVSYTKDPLDPAQQSDAGVMLFKKIMAQYYPSGNVDDAFNFYGMAVAYTMVDALKKTGVDLTRKALLNTINNLNETDNPFLYPGVAAKNTPTDHYTITQEYQAKYDAAKGDYTPISPLINFRGQITFP
ncbi:MAG TPA: ABC transporter substrate-binding protein [Candidatus Dormibacteraeota bacterium]|nr:ABC transporter substrate-binding protein [Candidatus Dormibacteraeota bacterium]